ncbi:MAG: hypothetical protein AAGJ10_15400 [Bacteroidota bacterium]
MADSPPTPPSRLRRTLVFGGLMALALTATTVNLALYGYLPVGSAPAEAHTMPEYVAAVQALETPVVYEATYAFLAERDVTLAFLQELDALGLHGLTPAELVAVRAHLYSPTFFTTYEAMDASPEALRNLVRHQLAAMQPRD